MRVMLVAAEAEPLAAVGDLAQTVPALAMGIAALGHDVQIVLPHYGQIALPDDVVPAYTFPVETRAGTTFEIAVTELPLSRLVPCDHPVTVTLIGNEYFFGNRPQVYGYHDDAYRFAFFNLAVMHLLKQQKVIPDVLHTHDWHTGLLGAYLKMTDDTRLGRLANVFTVHEIMYQGTAQSELLDFAGLGWEVFQPDGLEFHRQVSLLKSGLVYSDLVSTTSELYAAEIQKAEFGAGLEGLLQSLHAKIAGITDGVDDRRHDPAGGVGLPAPYTADDLRGKARCKEAIQLELGLPVHSEIPIVLLPARHSDQGSIQLLRGIAGYLQRLEVQLVIYGGKVPEVEALFSHMPLGPSICVQVEAKTDLMPRLWAGADILLMPPRLKPRTEELRLALRYGTIPITYGIGGLDINLIRKFDPRTGEGSGFLFAPYTPTELQRTLKLALDTYDRVSAWEQLVANALSLDLSWATTARKYVDYYDKALTERQKAAVAP
jgi:starch synthase